jgi:hypothetical protein
MPTETEIESPQPLTDNEIKDGIAYKVAAAVRESLDKTCHLYGHSYPKFRAEVHIHYYLDDFGRIVEGNVAAGVSEGELGPDAVQADVDIEIPHTPPNQFRRETEQPIPTTITAHGQAMEKRLKYAPKRAKARE